LGEIEEKKKRDVEYILKRLSYPTWGLKKIILGVRGCETKFQMINPFFIYSNV
jgi:hypothetical protein